MKYLPILCLILAPVGIGDANASIGNNQAQITALYGKPLDPGTTDNDGVTTNMYQKGDYLILVQFAKGHSTSESYARMDKNKLSDREPSIFLKANSGGGDWKRAEGKLAWDRSNGNVRAWCETLAGRPTLLIHSKS